MSHIFLLDTGALKTTGGKAEVPSLDKEGWLRPLRKCREASLAGAGGVVGSSHRLSEVERTTPATPPKERDHLLDGAATPPLPRRGLRLSRRLSQTPCPADDLWVMISLQGVSRAVLLASAKTHKKLRPRKQRTYRRSSLRGEYVLVQHSFHTYSLLSVRRRSW